MSLLPSHRAHEYAHLVRRWRSAARALGLRMQKICETDGMPVFVVESARTQAGAPSLYLSAGVHGDEPAGTEALIAWVESGPTALGRCHLLIFPCMNPWGLKNNSRFDSRGRDLNRLFHRRRLPLMRAWRAVIAGRRFDCAMMLHEDFDAQGIYLYEIHRPTPPWGDDILRAASKVIPLDPRKKIERSRAVSPGLIRRRIKPGDFVKFGYPEAVTLHFEFAERTFTIETPSEFSLDERVNAHVAALDAMAGLAARFVSP